MTPGDKVPRKAEAGDYAQPSDLIAALSSRVHGQDGAVRTIACLLSIHSFTQRDRGSTSDHRSPNALLFGPTGVGKTFTLQAASRLLNLPCVIVDCTSIVNSGIVGVQVEDILEDLVRDAQRLIRSERRVPHEFIPLAGNVEAETQAIQPQSFEFGSFGADLLFGLGLANQGNDGRVRFGDKTDDDVSLQEAISLAERGIIVLDEIDKLAGDQSGQSREMMGVQSRLLKLIEGANLSIGIRSHGQKSGLGSMNTERILVIGAGAFQNIAKTRSAKSHATVNYRMAPGQISTDQLISFGLLPELVARMPVHVTFQDLDVTSLRSILADEELGPLSLWKEYLSDQGLSLEFPESARDAAVNYAHALGLGARALPQVLFPAFASKLVAALRNGDSVVRLEDGDFLRHPNL